MVFTFAEDYKVYSGYTIEVKGRPKEELGHSFSLVLSFGNQ